MAPIEHSDEEMIVSAKGTDTVRISYIKAWTGWTEVEKCKVCKDNRLHQTTLEVEWTDPKDTKQDHYYYCSEMCYNHFVALLNRDEIRSEQEKKTIISNL